MYAMRKLSLLVLLAGLACQTVQGFGISAQSNQLAQKTSVTTEIPSLLRPVSKSNDLLIPTRGVTEHGLFRVPGFNTARRNIAKAPAAGSEPIYGTVVYSEAWPGSQARFGVYELPTNTVPQQLEAIYLDNKMYANGGAVYAAGEYIVTNYVVYESTSIVPLSYIYDASTWELKGRVDGDLTSMATDMAYDEITEQIYGCFYSADGSQMSFGVLDPLRGRSTRISTISTAWNACAVDPSGVLYAIDMNGILSTVNKSTGEMTTVGDTGLRPRYISSATFNPLTGKMYYVCCPSVGQSYLYDINTETAEPTLLYELPGGEGITGLYIPRAASGLESPAAVSNLELLLDGASLSATIAFDMPAENYGGAPISGTLGYNIIVDGTIYTTGTAEAGQHVTVPLTVEKAATYNIAVETTSDKGNGPKTRLVRFIGADSPSPVHDLSLTALGENRYSLSWTPVTTGENGGYIDPSAVTYTVTRYTKAESTVVANALSQTSFSDIFTPENGASPLSYGVSANIEGYTTAEAISNVIIVGAYSAPYSEDFGTDRTDNTPFSDYTVIDAANDGKTWQKYNTNANGNCWAAYYPSSDSRNDDWLITPPIYLEGGNQYDFSFDAGTFSNRYPETFEVAFGTEPTVAGMSTTVIEETTVVTETAKTRNYTASVVIKESGIYYFGIHATTVGNSFYLYADNIKISSPRSTESPAAATDFTVTRHWDGSIKADLKFTAPVLTASGKKLESIDKIEILRDGELVHTIQPVLAPGLTMTWTDDDRTMTRGDHIYTIAAYNGAGRGNEAQAEAFIGVNRAEEVPNPRAELTEVPGQVRISWDAPSVDIKGEPLNLDIVTYSILSTDKENNIISIASGLKELEYIDQAVPDGAEQMFKSYAIVAVTDAGMSSAAATDIVVPGPAYEMPYTESFTGHTPTHIIGTISHDPEEYSVWGFYSDTSQDGIVSQDADDGYVVYRAKTIGARSAITSGKIRINDGPHPVLSFYFLVTDPSDANTYEVEVTSEGRKEIIATVTNLGRTNVRSWERAVVPLDKYAGKEIQIALWVTCIQGENGAMGSAAFDNFRVFNNFDHNLTVREFDCSSIFDINTDSKIRAIVENLGTKRAENYRVDLFIDGDPAGSVDGPAINPMSSATVTFTHRFTNLDPEKAEIVAQVVYDADQYPDDDLSPVMNATILLPDYPVPAGLKARYTSGSGVELNWEPVADHHTRPVALLETFEDYDSWEKENIGQWLSIDRDGHRPASFEEIEFPVGTDPLAFFVLDNNGLNASFAAHSGNKMLSNLPAKGDTGSDVNDWLISPELNGSAQTLSFYARSYHNSYRETFQILLSDSNNECNSFNSIAQYSFISNNWQRYEFDAPAGTKFFAIRCISKNEYMLLLDDFTFIAKNGPVDLTRLTGYNIYRDGFRINEQPVTGLTFTDPDGRASNYIVTAVYDKGESRPSDVANPDFSGICGAEALNAVIRVEGREIVVTGAGERTVRICGADGREIPMYNRGTDHIRASVVPGVYMVSIGSTTVTKVIVR